MDYFFFFSSNVVSSDSNAQHNSLMRTIELTAHLFIQTKYTIHEIKDHTHIFLIYIKYFSKISSYHCKN